MTKETRIPSKVGISIFIFLLVIILDQSLKIWVKTHMYLGESIDFLPWFKLLFVQNNGMAFGIELGSKIFLTLFRIIVAAGILWYIWSLRNRRDIPMGYVVCFSLIAAGAAGNIIDCMFYGEIFNDPYPPEIATLFPAGGGYAPFMFGKVVDMLYFPLFSFDWPSWMPFVGGEHFLFFQPVFNLADTAISVGLIALLIFYNKMFSAKQESESSESTPNA